MAKGIINIYGCGGAGINNARNIAKRAEEFKCEGFADLEVFYLDTSESNLNGLDANDPNVFVYTDSAASVKTDGSGKNRRHLGKVVMEQVKPVLLKFKPAEINIVISSNSGGSGSVIAPSLVSEMLQRGDNVILFCINSYEDRKALENVIACMKTYESISQLREQPVVACVFENNPDVNENMVNKRLSDNVIMLAALFSRNNEGMDMQDLRNWLHYDQVTHFAPAFSQLVIQVGEVKKNPDHPLITSLVLSPSRDAHIPYGFTVDYQKVGYFNTKNTNDQLNSEPINYLIYDGTLEGMFKKQQKMLQTLDEEASARITKRTILNSSDKAENNGMIF